VKTGNLARVHTADWTRTGGMSSRHRTLTRIPSRLAILGSITNQVKGYPFEVAIPSGLRLTGVILADQVKSVDWRARDATFLSALPARVIDAVLDRVGTLLTRE